MATIPSTKESPGPRSKRVSAVGYTSYPKESLSYRWEITDVKSLMSVRGELRGPTFEALLPTEPGKKRKSTWQLLLNSSGSIYLCCLDGDEAKKEQKPPPSCFSKYWITDCCFSVVDAKTDEIKHSSKPTSKCECLSGKNVKYGLPTTFLSPSKLDEYIVDDVLVLEVNASLDYLTDPIGISNETAPIPQQNTLEKLYEEQLFADITIKCSGREFKAHKAILASQSPVFKTMFETDMKETRENEVEINDIDPKVMSDMLAFLYTGKPKNLNTLAKDLLYAATKYELPGLVVMCENELTLNLHVSNLLDTVQYADRYGAPNLKKACLRMIKCNSSELFNSEEWKDFKNNSDKDLAYEVLEF